LRNRAHERDTATRNDEGFEPVGAQIGEQFKLWLIDAFGVQAFEFGLLVGRQPVQNRLFKLSGGHAGMSGH
jgi:hypothetical protein